MSRRLAQILTALVFATSLGIPTTQGQDATPVATPVGTPSIVTPAIADEWDPAVPLTSNSVPFPFPAPNDFGSGWKPFLVEPGVAFLDNYQAKYVSQYGDRIQIIVVPTYGRLSVAGSASDQMNRLFEDLSEYIYPDADFLGFGELVSIEPPKGCDLVRRIEGREQPTYFPAGLTLCQSDQIDAIILERPAIGLTGGGGWWVGSANGSGTSLVGSAAG